MEKAVLFLLVTSSGVFSYSQVVNDTHFETSFEDRLVSEAPPIVFYGTESDATSEHGSVTHTKSPSAEFEDADSEDPTENGFVSEPSFCPISTAIEYEEETVMATRFHITNETMTAGDMSITTVFTTIGIPFNSHTFVTTTATPYDFTVTERHWKVVNSTVTSHDVESSTGTVTFTSVDFVTSILTQIGIKTTTVTEAYTEVIDDVVIETIHSEIYSTVTHEVESTISTTINTTSTTTTTVLKTSTETVHVKPRPSPTTVTEVVTRFVCPEFKGQAIEVLDRDNMEEEAKEWAEVINESSLKVQAISEGHGLEYEYFQDETDPSKTGRVEFIPDLDERDFEDEGLWDADQISDVGEEVLHHLNVTDSDDDIVNEIGYETNNMGNVFSVDAADGEINDVFDDHHETVKDFHNVGHLVVYNVTSFTDGEGNITVETYQEDGGIGFDVGEIANEDE